MLDYIIKVLLFQTLFLVVYDILLKRETFFQWNRVYLISTSILSYIIPVLKFEKAQEILPQEYIILPEVLFYPTSVIEQKVAQSSMLFSSLTLIFWIGFSIAVILFSLKLYKLLRLIFDSEKQKKSSYWLVFVEQKNAFSFFRYIFLNKTILKATKEQVIEHELVHVEQKHSLDLLLFEIQRMVCWFNPYGYIYQHRISELHEFIADAKAIKQKDKTTYFEGLLTQTFGVNHISFINPFFKHSLIKKRIFMLNKNKSKQLLKLKYLLLIPILVGMLVYTSCEQSEATQLNKNEKRKITLHYGKKDKGKYKVIQSKKEGYFDIYMGVLPNGKEISYSSLSDEEKEDFDKIKNFGSEDDRKYYSFKVYEMKDGKKVILHTVDWGNMKKSWKSKDYSNAEVVPFASVDKAPVFPDCVDVSDPKKCFQEKIQTHVSQNFDTTIANGLGLDSDYKKIYVQFIIDKNGMITNIKSRAPHEDLEKEAIRIIKNLPKIQAGEYNGKKVAVKYTLPITFKVE